MNPDASMNENVPEEFQGLSREDARKKVVEMLDAEGSLVKVEDRMTPVVRAERSKEIIEYRLSEQWFVKMKPLAEAALKKSDSEGLEFFPHRWDGVYRSWLENSLDWCISRQIWWGHRIPAWYHKETGEILVDVETPKAVKENPESWKQDEDVLDTWFSSCLWPFSTFGWPNENKEVSYRYPTDVLVTAKDIIYLWVARMVMVGVFHRNDLPFKKVLINSVVCDEDGETMSKSKGNGVDPLHVIFGASTEDLKGPVYEARPRNADVMLARIDKRFPDGFEGVGADALRFSLVTLNTEAQQVGVSLKRFVEVGKPFTDKLWNACRFVLASVEQADESTVDSLAPCSFEDLWILGSLDRCIEKVRDSLESFRISQAFDAAHALFRDDFCDWYVELSKGRLKDGADSERARVRETLTEVLSAVLRIFHPAVPFITEELWGHLQTRTGSIDGLCAESSFPESKRRFNAEIEDQFSVIRDIVRTVRSMRLEVNLAPKIPLQVMIRPVNSKVRSAAEQHADIIMRAAFLKELTMVSEVPDGMTSSVIEGGEIYVNFAEHRDIEAELERSVKALEKVRGRILQLEKKLSNEKFVLKAPAAVVNKEKASLEDARRQETDLNRVLEELRSQE